MTDLHELHEESFRTFGRLVNQVRDNQWEQPTPCPGWTVRDVVGHLVREQLWVPHLLAGLTIKEVGDRYDGDVLGDDPIRAWGRSSTAARAAWREPGATERIVHLSFGDTPASDYRWQLATDLVVHTWDLARGTGSGQPIRDDFAEVLLAVMGSRLRSRQGSGTIGDGVPVADGAPAADRLLSLAGRDPRA
ncbi:TIGR03086 family metal-binding protein [Amycolatopsis eburnea]|uniref:TIGR03086 family protein n=1 Tax=Amycolatopsis eburnea TaxID=2267691 RepID=A0A3R9EP62_9PSEU|nr:TIGR03086 family metal-binding protein [Amycolatopsis eburnea]RSD14784.1 TIGR03086 family protein [Amycolatopsis eburnea]